MGDYPPELAQLLRDERLNLLGPGTPNPKALTRLRALNLETSFQPLRVCDPAMARACFAALWLYHDYLDESHAISQGLETPAGSYWHGIMHRREPDAANSKYWFRRLGRHAVFTPLRQAAADLAAEGTDSKLTRFLLDQREWDPFAFIDLCENCRDRNTAEELLCRRIQAAEWRLLFDDCLEKAIRKA